jgi:hypothetical protein
MAHKKTIKVPRTCPQLTMSQKIAQHEKFRALTDDINNACLDYTCKVVKISKKHGWYVFSLYLYYY